MTNSPISECERRMEGAFAIFERDAQSLRTGRAHPTLLDHVVVEVYGSKMPLSQLATVNVPEARLLSVQVWDQSNVPAIVKAISSSELGLNPSADGGLIRVPLPDLSEERRRELCKVAGRYAENARISIRNVRRDGMDTLKKQEKNSEISQDEQHGLGEEIQTTTDRFIKQIDELLAKKETDIMDV